MSRVMVLFGLKTVIALGIASALLWVAWPGAEAKPEFREAFLAAYTEAVGTQLDDLPSVENHCGVCHWKFTGGGQRNPYGVRAHEAFDAYPNTLEGRIEALHSHEAEDPDGDTFPTIVEITDLAGYSNTPTFPGLSPENVEDISHVDLDDVLPYLVPQSGQDTEPPVVELLTPNGGETWQGGAQQTVTWTATDNVAVTRVDLFYREDVLAHWKMIGSLYENTGTFSWFVHNTPASQAAVLIAARDAAGNQGQDASDAVFTITPQGGSTVPTTLRDFDQPGTQPFDAGSFSDRTGCADCHGGYDPAIEPDHNFKGTMMGQAARDPLFYACLAIAEQDAASSGDLCLRCHTPFGWIGGRSNPTNGEALTAFDRDGVSCDFCHRALDPDYVPGVSPPEDEDVLAGLLEVPTTHSAGQYVIDPHIRSRGPFDDPVSPHPFIASPFHQSSAFCGTCHDVSNPVFERTGDLDYAPGPLDEPAQTTSVEISLPIERTYSEWLHSDFVDGVYSPDFAGNKPDGVVSTCQDCHLRDVEGVGCTDPNAPVRPDLPLHDMMGGNTWMPTILDQLYPGEVDPVALADGASRAQAMLTKAALLDIQLEAVGDSFQAVVTVTNRTGHKLPSGYPEGRRLWLHVEAVDGTGQTVYESGVYDADTGDLHIDPDITIYEAKMGLSPAFAEAFDLEPGESFHFAINDTVYKDNRIPPMGFTNAAFAEFGGTPVHPEHTGPEPLYADGQYWDEAVYGLPASFRTVYATLYYQTTSKEYVEFLLNENTTNDAGQILYDLWVANGRAAPVAMVGDTLTVPPSGVAENRPAVPFALSLRRNPSSGPLELRLGLPRPQRVELRIMDIQGRLVWATETPTLGAGYHRVHWEGTDQAGRQAGPGVYWAIVRAGEEQRSQKVIRIR